METNIIMVRHAESPFVFGEERTRGLSEDGKAASMKVADILDGMDIHFVCSSPYARAIQTVRHVADRRKLPIIAYEQLRERAIKGLDYKAPWEELLAAIERSFTDIQYALDGGESTWSARQRAIPVIQQLLQEHEGGNIVIGTHGNIMAVIMQYFHEDYGYAFWNRTSKPDIYRLTFQHGELQGVERMWDEKLHGKL
ncbi:histidine phosphatase family protein [Paenibacillus sp. J5C_2022]|uniref:histidine phosphatase family protein n=1 Tax=Paenibacillus sp. J5C2022 TaxID=2977129 RepID=UPI0021CF6C10|nr:histidine phosphatase family protein [Paenibacillus sp. J5C2022]MCU6713006.1 histidine phosphatase family protein [Paenibacillus sp. J5C2022]